MYKRGNVVFLPDGNGLLSPVGNRVTYFDLVANTSLTLPFENRTDIDRIAVSHDGTFAFTIDASAFSTCRTNSE